MSLDSRPRTSAAPPLAPPERKPFAMANPRRRAWLVFIAFAVVVSLFVGRLVELQVFRAGDLATKALGQRIQKEVLPPTRGDITDINGVPLAVSVEVRHITADQTLVNDAAETAAALAPILDMTLEELVPKLDGERRFIYLKKDTPPEVWRSVQAARDADGADRTILQGIFSEVRTIRDYPNKQLIPHVVGFTNSEDQGATGLESGLNDLLSGEPGEIIFERAATGTEIPTSDVQKTDPVPGTDVRLTIDADLQWTAQQAINSQTKATKSDFGMVVAMEVDTGRILAMATGPSFDPHKPDKVKPEQWANRPLTWAIEPGSTAKLMSIAAVLDQGAMKPRTPVTVPGTLYRGGQNFNDSHAHGTLHLTLAGVLATSSNIGTILAAEKIGGEKLYEYLKAFGVGEPTGINFPGEQTGYLPHPDTWSDTSFPTLAFGQGMSLTAVQLASMVATIGNDGVYVPPQLIDSYTRPDGTKEAVVQGEERRVLQEKTAKTMQKLMQLVVQDGGTATNAAVPGYLMGGKTGTAQRYDETCSCYAGYTGSFIGMAPADDPKIVVGAWLDNPKGAYYGGVIAGPVVQQVMTAALASRGIPPSGAKAAKVPLSVNNSPIG